MTKEETTGRLILVILVILLVVCNRIAAKIKEIATKRVVFVVAIVAVVAAAAAVGFILAVTSILKTSDR